MDIKEYLESNFEITKVGDNYQLDCPFCDDNRSRLGVHKDSGSWRCFNCDSKGKTFRTFVKQHSNEHISDSEIKDPSSSSYEKHNKKKNKTVVIDQTLSAKFASKLNLENRQALSYLKNQRGFRGSTIKHFNLGSWKSQGFEYVAIPFWKNGQLVNIKFRAIDFKDKKFKWRRIPGGDSSLFNDDVIDHDYKVIFICEAEFDAMALWNAGIKNVVSVTVGAGGFKQEWYDRLEKYKKIYLVYDNDVPGQAGAEKMAKRLGIERCFNVVLPKISKLEKVDVNNYFWDDKSQVVRNTISDFNVLVKDAKRIQIRDVLTLRDAMKEVYKQRLTADEDQLIGLQTRWKRVNKIMGGAKPGHLIVVSGPPKCGKTTWVFDWMLYLAAIGDKSFLYECEMRQTRVAEKAISTETIDLGSGESGFSDEDIFWANHAINGDNILIAYPQTEQLSLENVVQKIKDVVQRYGVKMVCFDNLHFLVRSDNVKDEIGRVTRTFKLLAEQLDIVFVLIVHPKKINGREPNADDLKDSSSIYQDLDTLVFVHRERASNGDNDNSEVQKAGYDPLTKIIIHGRWCDGGSCYQYFDGTRSRFYEEGELLTNALQKRMALKKKSSEVKNVRNIR